MDGHCRTAPRLLGEHRAGGGAVGTVVAEQSFPEMAANYPEAGRVARNQFAACQARGQKVLGYVSTRVGPHVGAEKRPLEDIRARIDAWYEHYSGPHDGLERRLDGIYLDEAVVWWDLQDARTFFTSLIAEIKGERPAGQNTVMILAGQCPDEWVVQEADYAVLWEEKSSVYLDDPKFVAINSQNMTVGIPDWWRLPQHAERIVHTVWNCPSTAEMLDVLARSRARNAGNLFVLDQRNHGYDHLPPYWDNVVGVIDETFSGTWTGTGTAVAMSWGMPGRTAPYRVELRQNGPLVNMTEHHDWVGSGLAGGIKNEGSGTVDNGSLTLETKEATAPGWTVDNRWTLSLPDPINKLHLKLVTNTVAPPGEPFPPLESTTVGDLHRSD